ncbi:MAG: helix-turn-helix transcriptional regulator [Ruminiclostridium sp.]|nr:helix-turn-helix transcriptional regulator [Ruminiclostridium sp.]
MTKTIYPIIPDSDSLPLTLTGIGETDSMKPLSCRGAFPCRFLLTAGGEGTAAVDGQTHTLRRGSFCCIAANTTFSLSPEGADWSAEWLTLGGSIADELLRKLGFPDYIQSDSADTGECENLFRQLMTAAGQPIPEPRIVSALLYAFVLAAQNALMNTDTESYNCSIDSSVDHINRHYGEEITLERLAAMSGVSLQHFCRVFRAKLGMRPMEYLARTRVTQAKILLGETDMKISDIAAAVGFGEQNYFGITFKKYEGVSPTEYRKERGSNAENGG